MFVLNSEDGSNKNLALGLYLNISVINHSCNPNATHIFYNNGYLSIKSKQNIEPNTEITISYCDIRSAYFYRQEALSSVYCFDCDCEKCKFEKFKSSVDEILGEVSNLENTGIKLRENFDNNNFSKINDAIYFVDKELLPIENITMIQLNEYLFDHFLGLENSPEGKNTELALNSDPDIQTPKITKNHKSALKYGKNAVKGGNLQKYNDVLHGITTLKVSKLLCFMEKFEESRKFLKSAYEILNISFDRDYNSEVMNCIDSIRCEIEHRSKS